MITRRGLGTAAGLLLGLLVVSGLTVLAEFGLDAGLHWSDGAVDRATGLPFKAACAGLAFWALRRHGKAHWFRRRDAEDPPAG